MKFAAVVSMAALLGAAPTWALNITNMDDQDQTVIIEGSGNAKRTIMIPENETFQTVQHTGRVWTQDKPDRKVRFRQYDRMVIWPSGSIQIQKQRELGGH